MGFLQLIEVGDTDPQALADHITSWHREQHGTAPGYLGARLLADTDRPGWHVIEVDFSSAEEAQRNNDRPETAQWAETPRGLGTVADDAFRNCREVFATRDLG